MMRRDAASEAQLRAAEPARSTWLSANAGSGKTRVLTDRVARLLLGGTEPNKILCLTYTKAAAAEMQNRLLERLGKWAMLPEDKLAQELWALGEEADLGPARLAEARRLFAKAIETPGGLKIQTIHSFCAALLRRFPLEAGVSHGFREMDDRAGMLLRADILSEIASGPQVGALDGVAPYLGEARMEGFIAQLLRHRAGFEAPLDRAEALALFGLAADDSFETLLAQTLRQKDLEMLQALAAHMAHGGVTDQKNAIIFRGLKEVTPRALSILEGLLLYKTEEKFGQPKLGSIPTKTTQKGPAGVFVPEIDDLMERVAQARGRRIALRAADRALALHRFATAFLPLYDARKSARGWLDFDDLIARAGGLLSNPSVAQWVLFRLDGGIDHILVDEAQDTSPAQWRVIEALADEFTSGEGARDVPRTLFVVGDKKQSIYSFQGADLEAFDAIQRHFSDRYQALETPMQELELAHSFRSSPAILRLVDLTFDERVQRGIGGAANHIAFFEDLPGRVDLWPPEVKPEKSAEDENWEDPCDLLGATDAKVVLARKIAREIRRMIETGVQIPQGKTGARPVHEGDFLILVQRRSTLFAEIIRACKAEKLAIAGADRLKLGGELAVNDIRSLLGFLVTPEDDLALAEVLRSPLFGWDEARLYALAQPRKGYLWEALRQDPQYVAEVAVLTDLRNRSDYLRPYELIERLLTLHRGREKLLARLGVEAEEGIDELLAQALAFEQAEVPSLTGFLGWLNAGDVEVKRQLDGEGRAIRVMTVHGAKGLEAPIVILPETGTRKDARPPEVTLAQGRVVATSEAPDSVVDLLAEQKERAREERMRLLYVALTRAENWLIICAAEAVGEGADSWYSLVAEAMPKAGAEVCAQEDGEILRLSHGDWPDVSAPETRVDAPKEVLPDWAWQAVSHPEKPLEPLSPSGLGGEKAIFSAQGGGDQAEAMARGTLVHELIEQALRGAGADLARYLPQDLAPDLAQQVLDEAGATLQNAALRPYLTGLSEVEFTTKPAALAGRILQGSVDLLWVGEGVVKIFDFKTNATVPSDPAQVPEGILRQMGAYRAAMQEIYPEHEVVTAIYWTASAELMWLESAQVDAAFARATLS